MILSKLHVEEGDIVSAGEIEEGIREVYGTTNFTKVTYTLTRMEGSDGYLLTLQTEEKNPVLVKGSFHYDNVFSAGIVLNFTLRNLLTRLSLGG